MLFQNKNLFLLSESCVVADCVWTLPLRNPVITWWTLWLSCLLALLSGVVINTGVVSLCILISLPLAVCPGVGFFFGGGGSYVSSIFNVLNSLHTVLHRDYANLPGPPNS